MKSNNAIAVMLKAPVAGHVKTRLVPPLTQENAAELYKCFIKDIFARIDKLEAIDVFAAFTPAESEEIIKKIIPKEAGLILQKGIDLGERLANLFAELFTKGCKNVVVIGSDSPDLPLKYIKMAFDELKTDQGKIIFGPAEDGGYYLVGMNRFHKKIFENIPWSTDKVLKESLKIARKEGIGTFLLPKWHDIDIYSDLQRLIKNKKEIPNTYDFIKAPFLDTLS